MSEFKCSTTIHDTAGVRVVDFASASVGEWKTMDTLRIACEDATDGNPKHFNLRVLDGEGTTLQLFVNLHMDSWWRRALNWLRVLFGMEPQSLNDDDTLVSVKPVVYRWRP